jgi:predicted transposase YdaD
MKMKANKTSILNRHREPKMALRRVPKKYDHPAQIVKKVNKMTKALNSKMVNKKQKEFERRYGTMEHIYKKVQAGYSKGKL